MRFTSLSLENYGCFEAVRLSLDPKPGHINLVLAPNGGGKTVLRRAFRDLLFGIPGQTAMAFRFGYPGMRIIAEATDNKGASIAIGRRKGTGNTLVDGAGNSLDPGVLKRLVGEADDRLFERLFALDTQLLRSGADAMLASGGDIAEALFAAGSGIAGVRRMRTEFEILRDQLAPERRVAARPFYQAIAALTEARSDLRASTIGPQAWERLTAALASTRERRAILNADQANGQADIERLQRMKRVRPWLDQWSGATRDSAALADAPRLPPDTGNRWRDALQAVELARQQHQGSADHLPRLPRRFPRKSPTTSSSRNRSGSRIWSALSALSTATIATCRGAKPNGACRSGD